MSMTKNANGIALTLGVAAITAISLVAMLLLSTLGIPFGAAAEVKKEEPPAPSAEVIAQLKESPAWGTLRASLESPPGGWNGTANIIDSPQSPYPFSCSTDGVNPVISLSRAFTVNGRPLQVMTTAYTAGLGSKGMADRFAKVRACAGGDAGITTANLTGIGVEAYQIDVNKAGAASRDIMWRYGDVVVYLIAESNNYDAYNLAKSFNDNLVQKVNGVCLANDSSEADWGRTPWGNSTFTGLITDRKVEIEKVGLPAIPGANPTPAPTGSAAPAATPAPTTAPTFEAHPLQPAKTELPDVDLPVKPTAYPVWPLLPQPVNKPSEPESPAKEPPFQSSVKEQVEDVKGPGCGWAFTGTVAPLFKATDAKAAADELEKAEKTRLAEESKNWQAAVLQYWKDYDAFKKQVPAWNAYVDNVNTVAAAWDAISRKWATYNANKEIWDRMTEERKTFLERQKSASESYAKAIEQCKIQDETDEKKEAEAKKKAEEDAKKKAENPQPTASPSPSASASASPSPSPTPTEVRLVCPPIKPAIIDQAAPADPGPAPVPPADPRPADQRG